MREDDAEFGDQSAQAVVQGGAFFDEALPGAVQGERGLLVFVLDGDEAHLRTGDGFADGGGIGGVVLAAFAAHAVGGDEHGGDEADGVAVPAEQTGPVVGAGAGFHADQARRQVGKQRQQLVARDLGFDQLGTRSSQDNVSYVSRYMTDFSGLIFQVSAIGDGKMKWHRAA